MHLLTPLSLSSPPTIFLTPYTTISRLSQNGREWKNTPAAKSLDSDAYRGTGFTWMTSFIMMIQMCISVIPIYTMGLGFTLSSTFAMLLPAMFLHALVWNALHPNMHGLLICPLERAPLAHGWRVSGTRRTSNIYTRTTRAITWQEDRPTTMCAAPALTIYWAPTCHRPSGDLCQEASIAKMNKPVTDPVLA